VLSGNGTDGEKLKLCNRSRADCGSRTARYGREHGHQLKSLANRVAVRAVAAAVAGEPSLAYPVVLRPWTACNDVDSDSLAGTSVSGHWGSPEGSSQPCPDSQLVFLAWIPYWKNDEAVAAHA
jgi:hypothetical protein